ncbi:hypothetical protein Acsp02_48270 [Actinoplanes sp. NBRC 103695]|nr:hypothetical protein Acsp02_48270 [Actinoplanes sp. NBRC 103695]
MRRHGFEYTVAAPGPAAPEFPYGNDDPAWAAEHGFGVAHAGKVLADRRRADPNYRYAVALTAGRREAYQTALDGGRAASMAVPLPDGGTLYQNADGCVAEAQRGLYGDLRTWFRTRTLLERLSSDYRPRVIADDRYRSALTAWAACVQRRGYPVETPAGLRDRVAPATSGRPGRAEIRAAVAEADCAAATGLVRSAHKVEAEYAARTYAENRDLVEQYQKLSVRALVVARGTTGGE